VKSYSPMKHIFLNWLFFAMVLYLSNASIIAQNDIVVPDSLLQKYVNAGIIELMITDKGDTVPVFIMPVATLTSSNDPMYESRYRRMKDNTIKVYPYAHKAVNLMKEIDEVTNELDRRKDKKKYLNKLEDELKDQFKHELTNLTTTQGKILVNIIERETGQRFFDIVKDLKSGVSAFFFQQIGKRYGYDLKDGYNVAENQMLEKILTDLDADPKYEVYRKRN
jgi:hypothetical protein